MDDTTRQPPQPDDPHDDPPGPSTGSAPDPGVAGEVDPELLNRLDAIDEQIRSLEGLLDEIQQGIAEEVRVRRLVVVEEDGFERVVIDSDGTTGALTMRSRPAGDDDQTLIDMYAHDDVAVGLQLFDQGNCRAAFELVEGRGPVLWLDEGDSPEPPANPGPP